MTKRTAVNSYDEKREQEVRALGNAIAALAEYPFESDFQKLCRPLVNRLIQRLDNIDVKYEIKNKKLYRIRFQKR